MTRYVLGSEVAVSEDSDAGSSEPESAVPGGGIAWPLNKSSRTKSQVGVSLFRWCNDNHLKGTINKIKELVLNCNTSKHDVALKKLWMLKTWPLHTHVQPWQQRSIQLAVCVCVCILEVGQKQKSSKFVAFCLKRDWNYGLILKINPLMLLKMSQIA